MVSVPLIEMEAKESSAGGEHPTETGSQTVLDRCQLCSFRVCLSASQRIFTLSSMLWFMQGPGGEQDQLVQERSLLTTRDRHGQWQLRYFLACLQSRTCVGMLRVCVLLLSLPSVTHLLCKAGWGSLGSG